MTGLVWWIRRGLGPPSAVVVFAFVLTSVLTQSTWQVEWDWGARLSAASVLMMSPLVAAAAAYDTSRRWRPTLAELGRGSSRRGANALTPSFAVATCACLAYVAVWIVSGVAVMRRGGVGPTDFWVYPEVLLPVVVAALVGGLTGYLVDGILAAPAAVLAILAATVMASPFGRGPFEAVTTYGTLTGLQRTPSRAASTLVALTALGVITVVASLRWSPMRRQGRVQPVLLGLAATLAVILPAAWPWDNQVYEASHETVRCVGRHPEVCGPGSRLQLLTPVQQSLASAYRRLDGTQFVAPTRFTVTRLDHYSRLGGAAPLDFDPADVTVNGYSPQATASALVRPHQCAEEFSLPGAEPLLDAEETVQRWLVGVLTGHTPPTPVPGEVAASFRTIQSCRVMTGDLS